MFAPNVYNPIPTGYQYPTQPPAPAPVYPPQFNGFYPQTTAPPRGQSVPATNRQYPAPSTRPYGQYPPVPPATQTYKSTKSRRKRSKKRSATPPDEVVDQSLYSDKEKNEHSRSPSAVVQADNVSTKQEETNGNEHEQQSQASAEQSQGPVNPPEEQAQASSSPKEKRKSRSKKKRHHHHHRYEQANNQYIPAPPPPPSAYFGTLPPQMRVHQQPLYTGYNQAYEESIRRGDVYQKQAKRSTRLPPEAKQQLLPHEDDNKKPFLYTNYPQPTYNPYQGNFYSTQAPAYNLPPRPPSQAWPQVPPAEQEIQRLRSHIHTLEGELHKLQKKLSKTAIHHDNHSPRQTPLIVELNNHANESSHFENEGKPGKSSREETAAQLAHAAAAHVNARQQVPAPPPPPPPPPPPSSSTANYSQQRNFNQSNNNETIDRKNDDERQRRSADKILDAFERFYMNKSSATPMKVKYIPEDSHTDQERNINNNNNHHIRDRSSSLSN